jgi:hypothetical protein
MLFFTVFTLCSARVSVLIIVLNDRPYEKIRNRDTRPIFREDSSLVFV